jgi:hypothetical protein
MTPLRQMLHRKIAEALGCNTEEDYKRRKSAVLRYLKRVNPEFFNPEGGRKRSFQRMAEIEGITLAEKMEDLALSGDLLHQASQMTGPRASKEEVLAELGTLGLDESDMAMLHKVINEIDSRE